MYSVFQNFIMLFFFFVVGEKSVEEARAERKRACYSL